VLHQTFIPATHQHINSYKGEIPNVYATIYARSDENQMWIFNNSKELLANLKAQNFSQMNSIKTHDFWTLYTTIFMIN
jgi:dolichyl-phosphate-mannose--protein O-mannosyl transferase